LVGLEFSLESAEIMRDQDCGPVSGHGVGFQEEVGEDVAGSRELGPELRLERFEVDGPLSARLHKKQSVEGF
jgi:hypothetical protein